MTCSIGMAMNVSARRWELEGARQVPPYAEWEILHERLTYEEAIQVAAAEIEKYGARHAGRQGNQPVGGRVWNVFRVFW